MEVVVLDAAPSLPRLLARAALTARGRGGGLPSVEVRLPGLGVERERLLAYQRVCGFGVSDVLPHTYPHVLGFPLQVALMTHHDFPLALPGLVHVENAVTAHRRLTADDRLDLAVRAEGLRAHPKGQVVDLVTEVEAGGERVWEGRSTYLRRGGTGAGASSGPVAPPAPDLPPVAMWHVPGGQGRAYAAVSGDVNPIHLHALTARALGFPRAIAHGMWSTARTLAVLGPATAQASRSRVWFRRPVLLPSAVVLSVEHTGGGAVVAGLTSLHGGVHHLTLSWEPLG